MQILPSRSKPAYDVGLQVHRKGQQGAVGWSVHRSCPWNPSTTYVLRTRPPTSNPAPIPGGTHMKALTIRQPYASLIALGAKHYETRTWTTDYRGPLLIHAARSFDNLGLAYLELGGHPPAFRRA